MQISFDVEVKGFCNQPPKFKIKYNFFLCGAINELKLDLNASLNKIIIPGFLNLASNIS